MALVAALETLYRKVENEHVTNNKDDINRITEDNSKYGEIVDILLSEPKIKSIPGNENVEYRKTNGADNKDDINNIVEYNSKYEELVNILFSKATNESIPDK